MYNDSEIQAKIHLFIWSALWLKKTWEWPGEIHDTSQVAARPTDVWPE